MNAFVLLPAAAATRRAVLNRAIRSLIREHRDGVDSYLRDRYHGADMPMRLQNLLGPSGPREPAS